MEEWFLIASNLPICFSIHIYYFLNILLLKSFFFTVDHFYGFYWICYNIAYFVFWFFGHQGLWHLSSPARDRTCTPYIGRWILNHWTTRKSQYVTYVLLKKYLILKSKSYENQQNVECWMTTIAFVLCCAVDEWFTKLTFRLTKLEYLHSILQGGCQLQNLMIYRGGGWWKEAQDRGDIRLHIIDSCSCTAETTFIIQAIILQLKKCIYLYLLVQSTVFQPTTQWHIGIKMRRLGSRPDLSGSGHVSL